MSSVPPPSDPVQQDNPYAAPATRVDDVLPEGEMALAGRGTRLLAAIVDGIVMAAFQWALVFALGLSMLEMSQSILTGIGVALAGMGFYVAINYYLLDKYGQSIGKKVMNIKIVRTDGSKIPVGRIIGMRLLPVWLVSIIPIVGGVLAVIDALFIFRQSHQCLHDTIADTIVVKVATT